MKLSLCIATYNEESFIHFPLDSSYDFVDEVIIVDGSSSDRTVQKAKSYGNKVKVFTEENPPMFHINKQKAIERSEGNWILQLDADEAVTPELKREILDVVTGGGDKKTVAYWIPRKNYFLGRFLTKGGLYPDYTIRLYKKGVAHFPCKTVHENVEISPPRVILNEVKNQAERNSTSSGSFDEVYPERSRRAQDDKSYIGYLKNDLLHYADPKFDRYLKRWRRYTTLDARILIKDKEKPGMLSYFIVKPIAWFLSAYGRHKGFLDGWQGFVFAFFSSIRFFRIYTEYQKLKRKSE